MLYADNPVRRIDLQLFAEEEGTPETTIETTTETTTEESTNPLLDYLNRASGEEPGGEPQDQGTSEETAEEQETVSAVSDSEEGEQGLILGKFKNQDELIKAYQEAEKRISQYGEQFAELKQQWEEFKRRYETPQEKQELTPEQLAELNEKWLSDFYEKPIETLTQLVSGVIDSKIRPLVDYYQQQQQLDHYTRQIEEARGKYADFDDLLPEIERVVEEQGQLLAGHPNGVELAYQIAKARRVKPPDQLLQDPDFRQRVLQDEEIKNEIIKEYLQQVKDKQPPVVIGKQPGQSPATPPTEIKSTQDAKKASLSYFQRLLGGKA